MVELGPDRAAAGRGLPPRAVTAQIHKQNTQEMLDSQSMAIVAGLAEAGIRALHITVQKPFPARRGRHDQSRRRDHRFDGQPVRSRDDLTTPSPTSRQAPRPGSRSSEGGPAHTVMLPTEANPTGDPRSRIGIELDPDNFDPPFTVSINLGQDIGGPSAGLMFSLAIYDKLTPGAAHRRPQHRRHRHDRRRRQRRRDRRHPAEDPRRVRRRGARLPGARSELRRGGRLVAGRRRRADQGLDAGQAVTALQALNSGNTAEISRCGS